MADRVQAINTIKKELLPQTSEDEPVDVDEELEDILDTNDDLELTED
jgi:hypothetical protein